MISNSVETFELGRQPNNYDRRNMSSAPKSPSHQIVCNCWLLVSVWLCILEMVWAVQASFNPSMHVTPHNRQTSCVDNIHKSSTCRLTIHKYSNSCQTTVQFKPFCFRHWLFIWVLPGNSYWPTFWTRGYETWKALKFE